MRLGNVNANIWNTPDMLRVVSEMASTETVCETPLAIQAVGDKGMPKPKGVEDQSHGSVSLPGAAQTLAFAKVLEVSTKHPN